jgi:hypothetical protein
LEKTWFGVVAEVLRGEEKLATVEVGSEEGWCRSAIVRSSVEQSRISMKAHRSTTAGGFARGQ